MRISDWSSDVCSSDLRRRRLRYALALDQVAVFAGDSAYRTPQRQPPRQGRARRLATSLLGTPGPGRDGLACTRELHPHQPGEAWECRARDGLAALVFPPLRGGRLAFEKIGRAHV